jgi:hypothetical protein
MKHISQMMELMNAIPNLILYNEKDNENQAAAAESTTADKINQLHQIIYSLK